MKILDNAVQATYLYRNGYLSTLSQERKDDLIGKNLYQRIKSVLGSTFKELKAEFKFNFSSNLRGKTLAVINSQNNYNALSFLKSEDVAFYKFTVFGESIPGVQHFYLKGKFFYSLLFLLITPVLLMNKKNRVCLRQLHKSFGVNELFQKILKTQKPRRILFTNDHIPEMRAFLLAAKKLSVKTIYIQHGSVSKYFPPLLFDLALLESRYSLDTYRNIGISEETKIELIGMPKLDEAIRCSKKRRYIKVVGVAVNQNDEVEKIKEVISALLNENYKVVFRKHPLDFRVYNFVNAGSVIDGNQFDVVDFIQNIDFLIASDSSIHVEANSLQCRSLYYHLHSNENKKDYYSFVKNNFIIEAISPNMMIKYLNDFNYKDFDFFSENLKYYNDSLGSEFYGKSGGKTQFLLNQQ